MTTPSEVTTTRQPRSRRIGRWRVATWAPLMVLVLLCLIVTFINPNFLSFGNLVRITQSAMIPLVLGIGATFIVLMGSIDLSVEGVDPDIVLNEFICHVFGGHHKCRLCHIVNGLIPQGLCCTD